MKKSNMQKGSVIAALDIGSSKISCFIARLIDKEGHFEVVGVGHRASDGIKNGVIVDMKAAEYVIRQTVHSAEKMAAQTMKGYPLRDVILNIPDKITKLTDCQVSIDVSGHEISEHDIEQALAEAQDKNANDEMELVHTTPVSYTLDGQKDIEEPRGMVGKELGVYVHLISSDSSSLQNMANCIDKCHLDISALCLNSYASGLACLVDDEMELGCTVIDMGADQTEFAVFHGGNLIYQDAIPLGGRHVTNDIAQGLSTSITGAERIKTLYGSAIAATSDENEMIDVPPLDESEGAEPRHIPRSLLIGIMQPRLEEILEMVRARLTDSGVDRYAGRRIVLTGGTSQTPSIRDLCQLVMEKQVRLGKPLRINGLPETASGPAFSTTAGLLTYYTGHSKSMPGYIAAQKQPENMWGQVKKWLHDNW